MPHNKKLSHPNLISSIFQTISKSSQARDNFLITIKMQKQGSGYKKITHRHQASHQLMPLLFKKQQKSSQFDVPCRIPTQSGQKKQKKFKKNQILAFYEQKYTEQINRLQSNLCVKQVENGDKEKSMKDRIQRKSSFERRKNSLVELKLTKRGLMSPIKKMSHPPTIGICYKSLEDKQNIDNNNKLRLRAKLKPLVELGHINLINISSLEHQRRSARKSSAEKACLSEVRRLNSKNNSQSLLKELLEKRSWDEEIMPWQDTTCCLDQDPKFNSTFNSKI